METLRIKTKEQQYYEYLAFGGAFTIEEWEADGRYDRWLSGELPELIQAPSIIISESGDKFLEKENKLKELCETAALFQEAREYIESQSLELNRLRVENIEQALAIQTTGDHARARALESSILKAFLTIWLQEFEQRFEREKQADSNQIALDYIKHAEWMAKTFGRHNHSIKEVQAWIDSDNLPY